MKATEDHQGLYLRGMVMARGGYTFEQIKHYDQEELMFLDHYQRLQERSFLDRLTNLLGVTWNLQLMRDMEEAKKQRSLRGEPEPEVNELFIPLAVAINPQLINHVRQSAGLEVKNADGSTSGKPLIGGGDYTPEEGEVVKSMKEMSKDAFLGMIGGRKSSV
jgi:hypothetical protein